MKSTWVLAVVLAGASGCYRYVAAEPGALTTGTEVSVELSSTGTATVKPALGDFVTTVDGRVTEMNGGDITLALVSVRRRGEVSPSTWNGETLRLATADINSMRTRQFSRGRTTAAAVAVGSATVGLVIVIARAVGLLEVSGNSGKPIPPP